MINMIRNFSNIDFSNIILETSLFGESQDISNLSKKIYNYGKEISINLNDEISKTNIDENSTYSGIIHSIGYKLINMDKICVNINMNNFDKNKLIKISINGKQLKNKLYSIPGKILIILNCLMEYPNITSEILQNIHSYIDILSKSAMELIALTKIDSLIMNEDVNHKEDVSEYINELNNIIDDIRKYYEKSDYAKLLTPRKKKIDKMEEYVRGALDRKYTLRIPLYKIEDASKHTQDLIENKFIKDVQTILANYNNYVLLSPNWDEDEDIYIYLTLKEPFGKKGDDNKRKKDSDEDLKNKEKNYNIDTNDNSLNEATIKTKLSKKERDALSDDEFGLPLLRKYPLNDEEHIKQAIKMFHYCKPNYKAELAKNIIKKVKEFKLENKVFISNRNPFKKYFPEWMIKDSGKKYNDNNKEENFSNNQNECVVLVNGKLL